jgi:hypothetical protein
MYVYFFRFEHGKATGALTLGKVSKEMIRLTGVRRYDKLIAVVNDVEGTDWLATDSIQEAQDIFASTSEGL